MNVKLRAAVAALGLIFLAGSQATGAHLSLAAPAAKSKTLYSAHFRNGAAGWRAIGSGWSLHNGVLNFVGAGAGIFAAPYKPNGNYAIQVKIRLVNWNSVSQTNCCTVDSYGVLFRSNFADPATDSTEGLVGGVFNGSLASLTLIQAAFITASGYPDIYKVATDYDPGHSWHTFRVEVRGNNLKLIIDGSEATRFNNLNRFFANKGIGIISYGAQIQISRFKVVSI